MIPLEGSLQKIFSNKKLVVNTSGQIILNAASRESALGLRNVGFDFGADLPYNPRMVQIELLHSSPPSISASSVSRDVGLAAFNHDCPG